MVTWGIQRVPVVVLLLLIVSNHKETEGPSVASKILLVLASLIYLVNDLPISVWAEMVHESAYLLLKNLSSFPRKRENY